MRAVSAVLFDLDATLLNYDDSAYQATVHRVCAQLANRFPELPSEPLAEVYLATNDTPRRSVAGEIPITSDGKTDGISLWSEGWQRALATFGCFTEEAVAQAVELYSADRMCSYQPFDDVLSTLAELARRRYCLAVVTNGPAQTQHHKIEAIGLGGHFQTVVVSAEVGVAKPQPEIFDLALKTIGTPPHEAWYVGDSLETDVAGARRAALAAAVWLNRGGRTSATTGPQPDHEIASLTDLLHLLPR